MTGRVTILSYHAIEAGPPPLFVVPELFEAHLEVLRQTSCTVLALVDAARLLAADALPPRAVVLTFDDGFASVASEAVPRLSERGWTATVFCVAGHLGGLNDWPTQPPGVPRRPLASRAQVAEMAQAGYEIGAHTVTHAPLGRVSDSELRTEIVDARELLHSVAGTTVSSFASPYGDPPSGCARSLIESTYEVACGTRLGAATPADDSHALPRLDAHYLRRPELLRRVLTGRAPGYVAARRAGARARRLLVRDFAPHVS